MARLTGCENKALRQVKRKKDLLSELKLEHLSLWYPGERGQIFKNGTWLPSFFFFPHGPGSDPSLTCTGPLLSSPTACQSGTTATQFLIPVESNRKKPGQSFHLQTWQLCQLVRSVTTWREAGRYDSTGLSVALLPMIHCALPFQEKHDTLRGKTEMNKQPYSMNN